MRVTILPLAINMFTTLSSVHLFDQSPEVFPRVFGLYLH